MANTTATVNLLSILSVGRNLQWAPQLASATKPTSIVGMVSTTNSPTVMVAVCPRRDPTRREVRIWFPSTALDVADLAETYTLDINSGVETFVYDASVDPANPSSQLDILNGWKTLIDGASPTLISTAVEEDPDDGFTKLRIIGVGAADFVAGVTKTGATTLTAAGDATSCDMELYGYSSGQRAPASPRRIPGTLTTGLDVYGWQDRVAAAGFSALYVHTANIVGPADTGLVTLRVDVRHGSAQEEN